MNEKTEPKSLVTKLCEVVAATERVPKNGWNDFHKYNFARESDIVEAIRGELASRHIFIFPTITSHDRKEHTVLKDGKEHRRTFLTDIMVSWTFVDGESHETFAINIPGCGEDSGDKGFYKAFTGSEKYMLTKSFLIPTGDDPENDDKPSGAQATSGQTNPWPPAGAKQWAEKTFTLAQSASPVAGDVALSNGDSQQVGQINGVTASSDGACWFVSLSGFSEKGSGNTVWTRDKDLAAALVKSQGASVRAHLRSKKKGSYQLLSYIPE